MAEPKANPSCPDKCEPNLKTDYVPKGKEDKLGDLPIYTVGHGEKAIIYIYDIFGFNGGRTRQMCDQFSDAGYLVILPDFFRGESWDEANGLDGQKIWAWVQKFSWDVINKDLETHVYPYLEGKGVKRIGMVGCCFGGGMVMEACAEDKIRAGVDFHPVIDVKRSEEIAEKIKSPQLIIAAGNDPDEMKEGGIIEKVLKAKTFGDKVIVKNFPDMVHGFVPRARLDTVEGARDVGLAMKMAIDFLNENV